MYIHTTLTYPHRASGISNTGFAIFLPRVENTYVLWTELKKKTFKKKKIERWIMLSFEIWVFY